MDNNLEDLHQACHLGKVDVVRSFVESGVSVNEPICGCHGEGPGLLNLLCCSVSQHGNVDMVKYLLECGADVNAQSGHQNNTPLQIACSSSENLEAVQLLVNAGAVCDTQDIRGHTALHIAAGENNPELVTLLLSAGANPCIVDKSGRNPLHWVVSKGAQVNEGLGVIQILLKDGRIDVNAQDSYGYTALHLSAVNESNECVGLLIEHGGDVTLRTTGGTTALSMLVRKIPQVINNLVKRIDEGIKLHDHDLADVKCELELDFSRVIPTAPQHVSVRKSVCTTKTRNGSGNEKVSRQRKETDLLASLISTGNKKTLSHPLIQAFLFLKWRQVRQFFVASFIFQAVLVGLFTVFVIEMYLRQCPYQRQPYYHSVFARSADTHPDPATGEGFSWFQWYPRHKHPHGKPPPASGAAIPPSDSGKVFASSIPGSLPPSSSSFDSSRSRNDDPTDQNTTFNAPVPPVDSDYQCQLTWSLQLIWFLLIFFVSLLVLQESFQFLHSPVNYIRSSENVAQWALIASVMVSSWWQLVPSSSEYPHQVELAYWQYPCAAWGILVAWGLLLFQIGRFPTLGLYVEMLGKVAKNFGMFILAYACLLIGFALSFCILFPDAPPFSSLPLAMLKVFTIMVGEVSYEELLYNQDRSRDPLIFPVTTHLLFASFILIMTIVLMNLLVGLAVSDIQGLQKGAKLDRLCRQTQLIARFESLLMSRKLDAVLPSKFARLLNEQSRILSPGKNNCEFLIRPNDARDGALPDELKQMLLQTLVATSAQNGGKRCRGDFAQNQRNLLRRSASSVTTTRWKSITAPDEDIIAVQGIPILKSDVTRIELKLARLESQVEKIFNMISNLGKTPPF